MGSPDIFEILAKDRRPKIEFIASSPGDAIRRCRIQLRWRAASEGSLNAEADEIAVRQRLNPGVPHKMAEQDARAPDRAVRGGESQLEIARALVLRIAPVLIAEKIEANSDRRRQIDIGENGKVGRLESHPGR